MATSYERRHLPDDAGFHKRPSGHDASAPAGNFILLESDTGAGTEKILLESDTGAGTDAILLEG